MRFIVSALLALALLPGAALAGEAIATASPSQNPPVASLPPPLQTAAEAAADDPQPVQIGPCGPQTIGADGTPDRKPHGYVEAGVGTSGYRHIAAGVCKPLANGGAVAVSVSDSQWQGRRGR